MKTTLKNIIDFYNEYPEEIGNISVLGRFGYKTIEFADTTAFDSEVIRVETESGKFIEGSPEHLLLSEDNWKKINELSVGMCIETEFGPEEVVSILRLPETEDLYDLQVADVKEFYANGIVSHNSTFIEAITFALYGKPFRNINKPQLVNSRNGGDLLTEIEFSTNGKSYKVIRGIKPNIFEVYENGKLLNQPSESKDYQDILENKILKMNYRAFTHIVVIGNAIHTPFMQLKPAERRGIIENLLDIDIFSKMNVVLKQQISDLKIQLDECQTEHRLVSEKIKIHEKTLQNSRNNIDAKIDKNNMDIQNLQNTLEIKQSNLAELQQNVLDISEYSKTLKKTNEKIMKVREFRSSFETTIRALNKDIEFVSNNEECSSCHREFSEYYRAEFLSEKNQEHQKFTEALSKSEDKLKELLDELNSISEIMSQQNDISQRITKIQADISSIEKEISVIMKTNETLLKESRNDLKETQAEYDALNSELAEYSRKKESLIEENHIHSLVSVMLKDDGIKTRIIKNYLPEMNRLINRYMKMMDFHVSFNLEENFSETIKTANRESFSYNSFSEGEKMRIDLAILFTWREIARIKNSANTNLLILDEVFDSSLDSNGIEDFMRIINSFGHKMNIFIISHKEEVLSDRFQNTIKFEKVKGFTRRVA
jgi:DNA repair exonuclease SbcCD ATPase subunit